MTFDEALAELGIDPSVGAESARKAYLRLLKKRKPEVDPEGFMRLREAYELARMYLPSAAVLRAVEEQAEGSAPPPVRLETADGPIWLEIQNPSPDNPAEEPAPAAIEEIPPPIEEARAPIEEPPAPIEEPPAPSIEDLIDEGKLKKAASQATQALKEASVSADIGPDVPMPRTTLRLLLLLHQKERLADAAKLEKEFAAWLHSTGSSARLVSGHLAVWWSIARELSALPTSFPDEIRRSIARAALAGDLSKARYDASEFRFEQRLVAESAARDLRRYAPSLATFLADALDPPNARVEQPNSGKAIWVIVPILLAIVRIFAALDRGSTPSSYENRVPLPIYTGAPRSQISTQSWGDGGPRNVWDLVDSSSYVPLIPVKTQDQLLVLGATIEDTANKLQLPEAHEVALRVQNVRVAIEMGDCADAQAEMIGLITETDRLGSSPRVKLKPMVTKLARLLNAACEKAMADLRARDGGSE